MKNIPIGCHVKTATVCLIAAGVLGCGNKNIDAACQGTYETRISRNLDQHIEKQNKIFSYHFDSATKLVAFNDIKFPEDRTLVSEGVVTASKTPENRISQNGSAVKQTEWVEYNLKTNVLKYQKLLTSMSKDEKVLVMIGEEFESICTPNK